MSTWYAKEAVPLGTLEWARAQKGFFMGTGPHDPMAAGYVELSRRLTAARRSGWVGGFTSTMELYRVLTGQPNDVVTPYGHIWFERGTPDPYRLALVGGDLAIQIFDSVSREDLLVRRVSPDVTYRGSTAAEAVEAAATMEEVGRRLASGEVALQPFADYITAYLGFYRALRPGEEELIHTRT